MSQLFSQQIDNGEHPANVQSIKLKFRWPLNRLMHANVNEQIIYQISINSFCSLPKPLNQQNVNFWFFDVIDLYQYVHKRMIVINVKIFLHKIHIADFTESLRLTEVRIPNHVVRNNTVRLECHFDMNGEALYSVKWYKDGFEFYRYIPKDRPPAQVFEQNGVYVNVSGGFKGWTSINS